MGGLPGIHRHPQQVGSLHTSLGTTMIDILLATYNGERFVREQLESIFTQAHTQWRLLISDDSSSDGTLAAIRATLDEWKGQIEGLDSKVHILQSPHRLGSAQANFLFLLAHSNADYVMFCDQDDVWFEDKVERTYALMSKLERHYSPASPLLVHSDVTLLDGQGAPIAQSFRAYAKLPPRVRWPQVLVHNAVTGCTMMINRALADLLNNVRPEDMPAVVMHDHLAAILAAASGHVATITEPTMAYRQHGSNTVGAKRAFAPSNIRARLREGKQEFRIMQHRYTEQARLAQRLLDGKVSPQQARVLEDFCHLEAHSKAARIAFLVHSRTLKHTLPRAVMQLVWC